MATPLIFVREFAGLDEASYRVAGRRARNYWEFLEHVHNIFNKPWEQYNAHFHLDNTVCDGRVSSSEWEAGGYFEAEFVVDGRIVLFAHFEEVETRTREPEAEEGESWRWGWHGSEGPEDKWYKAREREDMEFDEWDRDPYPAFPEALPTNVPDDLPGTLSFAKMDKNYTPHSSQINGWTSHATPSTPEVITVNDSNNSRHLDTGIIIGRAKPDCCRDSNVRPLARAVLKGGRSVCVFIPSEYAKRRVNTRDIQITMDDVEFSKAYETIKSDEKRTMAIRCHLEAKHGERSVPNSMPPRTVTKKRKRDRPLPAEEEGPIIGHAKPGTCRFPKHPAIVRATVNKVGAVLAYISAEDSLKPGARSARAQFQMDAVNFTEDLAALHFYSRAKVIKERVLAKLAEGKAATDSVQQDGHGEKLIDPQEE